MAFIDRESSKSLHIPLIMEMVKPFSEVGRRLKSSAKPFTPGREDELRSEYHKIKSLMQVLKNHREFRLTVTFSLSRIENIRQSFLKATTTDVLELSELYEIKNFLYHYEKIRNSLLEKKLKDLIRLIPFDDLFRLLDPEEQKIPTFHISSKYSEVLASLRLKLFELNGKRAYLEQKSLERAQKELELRTAEKQVVVSRQNKKLVQKLDQSVWYALSDENFANLTFVFRPPEEIIKLEREQNSLRQKIEDEELNVRKQLSRRIGERGNDLTMALGEIARLDYLIARALFGCEINGIIPTIFVLKSQEMKPGKTEKSVSPVMSLEGAVNLFIKKELETEKIEYQAIDIRFNDRINIITGANMAGKSTLMKTIGQLFYLTAYAIPLPCRKAGLPLVDFIFFSSDSESSYRTDLSSFASELISINNAINQPGRGLFLIDEFARGTNPLEGESFARAIMELLIEKKGIAVSATHFTSPASISKAAHYRVIGLSREDYQKLKKTLSPQGQGGKDDLKKRIQMLHRYMNYQLESVESSNIPPRAALMIAEVLGIEREIIEKARSYMKGKKQ